ncbi:MAG: hypothetical protein H6537_07270 [Bacteroidales bacterium]|nr:hypothetical protein [Bacteroidales bacterium]HPD95096.1 hypothetical protein [Tenuifilaceae bacterium]HRX31544.1 hypothetical protein [Tenuifilaceae bacterium]
MRQFRWTKTVMFWTQNLVGNSAIFSINLVLTVIVGLLYSFRVTESKLILIIFGAVSPILFTFCIYELILFVANQRDDVPVPKAFARPITNRVLMLVDSSLILLFVTLLFFNFINYFIVRFLLVFLFPVIMLGMMRTLYFVVTHPNMEL